MRRTVSGTHPFLALLMTLLLALSALAVIPGGLAHANGGAPAFRAGVAPLPAEMEAWGTNSGGQSNIPLTE